LTLNCIKSIGLLFIIIEKLFEVSAEKLMRILDLWDCVVYSFPFCVDYTGILEERSYQKVTSFLVIFCFDDEFNLWINA